MHGYLRHLANFAYIVEAGSISGAASRLNASASSISDSVRILENYIGEPLLDRHRAGVTPTSRGADLYAQASQIVTSLDRALASDMNDRAEGVLTLTLTQEVADNGFHKVITYLRKHHPKLQLRLLTEDEVIDHSRFSRDLFLRVGLGGQVPGLTQHWTYLARIIYVAHPRLLKGADPSDAAAISGLPLLVGPTNEATSDLELSAPSEVLNFRKLIQLSSGQSRLAWARKAMGLAPCLSTSVETDLEFGDLIEVLPKRTARSAVLSLFSANQKLTPREAAVVDALNAVYT